MSYVGRNATKFRKYPGIQSLENSLLDFLKPSGDYYMQNCTIITVHMLRM